MASDDPTALLDFAEQPLEGARLPRRDRRGPPRRGLSLDAQAKARLDRLLGGHRRQGRAEGQGLPRGDPGCQGQLVGRRLPRLPRRVRVRRRRRRRRWPPSTPSAAKHDPPAGQAHRRGPRAVPARPARRGLCEGQGDRREVLRVLVLPPRQAVAGRAEVIARIQFFSRYAATAAFISRSMPRGELARRGSCRGPAGDDLDDGVAPELGERLLEELDGTFKVERVELAGDDVELAARAWGRASASSARGRGGCRRPPRPWRPRGRSRRWRGPRACAGWPSGPSGLKTASNERSWPPSPITSSIFEKSS